MEDKMVLRVFIFGLALMHISSGYMCGNNGDGKGYLGYNVLPGTGWDNLRNENKGRVVQLNFTTCQVTEDGKYMIPDGVHVTPLKSSQVDIYSEIIKNWQNYTSDIAATINADGTVSVDSIPINGKFSVDYQNVKRNQLSDDAVTLKVQARYIRYKAMMQPDLDVDPDFKRRVMDIAHHIQFGRKQSAKYESQLLVRDFGTHVVTGVDAGAAIVKVDHVARSLLEGAALVNSMISLAARAELFGISGDIKIDPQTLTAYQQAKTQSTIKTHGGPIFKPMNFSINDWIDGIDDDLVALDRSGNPLHFMITPDSFPELPLSVIGETSTHVESAIRSYYKHNSYYGCTDRDSPNFSSVANVDDGSCYVNVTGMTFGGLYQNCTNTGPYYEICDDVNRKNPLTGDFSCPEGFESVPLYSGVYSKPYTQQDCSKFMIFWEHCKSEPIVVKANYQTYWCAAVGKFQNPSGFMFGGIYTSAIENSLTQQKNCPPYFQTISIAEGIKVCVSDDYENAEKFAVPFSGFFSCQNGNAMSRNLDLTKSCPIGYSQHLAAEVDECDIIYCMLPRSLPSRNMIPVRMPPYMKKPEDRNLSHEFFVAEDGQSWTRIYTVNDSFHGFNGTVENVITDSGSNLDIGKLLSDRQVALGVQPTQNNDGIQNKGNGVGALKTHKPKGKEETRTHSNLPHREIAVVAGVSSAITLLTIFFIAMLIFSIKRGKLRDDAYKKMPDEDIRVKCS